jgi:hypothetical protein
MGEAKCGGCNAPIGSESVCEFCGRLLRVPVSADEEVDTVRAQSAAAQKMASDPKIHRGTLVVYWQNAYIPSSVAGLRLALTSTMANLPKITVYSGAVLNKDYFRALHARGSALCDALRFHDDASDQIKQEAMRHHRNLHDLEESHRVALLSHVPALAISFSAGVGAVIGYFILLTGLGEGGGVLAMLWFVGCVIVGSVAGFMFVKKKPYSEP